MLPRRHGKNLTVRLDDDLAADAEALARAEGKSLIETVKLALSEAGRASPRRPGLPQTCASDHRAGPRAARAPRQVTVEYLDLVDYMAIAAEVTGLSIPSLEAVTKLDLATSAPSADFGETEAYTELRRQRRRPDAQLRQEPSAPRRQHARGLRMADLPTLSQ
jgi:hypothetical protein